MRSVVVLITVTDKGDIAVDVRGPYSDNDSLLAIIDSARQLIEQGDIRSGKKT